MLYLEVLSNFTNKALEGQLADQKLSALLVLSNFTVTLEKIPVLIMENYEIK